MTLSNKRKNATRSSRSAFGYRATKKLAMSAPRDAENQYDGANSSSDPDSHADTSPLIIGVKARFKRSGSKILSILSWRSSSSKSGIYLLLAVFY